MNTTIDRSAAGERLAAIRDRLGGADVDVMAVTKGFGSDAIDVAVDLGLTTVGESYAQELLAKRSTIDALRPKGLDVWFIGRLQTNKVRQLVDIVDVYASVDRASLVRELAKRAPGARILVQVNATGEEQKGGCPVDDVEELVAVARASGLDVRGLLAMGPTDAPPEAAAPAFAEVVELADRLGLAVRSLGMSGDLEVAVAAGSTQVRVGSALFGPRPPR